MPGWVVWLRDWLGVLWDVRRLKRERDQWKTIAERSAAAYERVAKELEDARRQFREMLGERNAKNSELNELRAKLRDLSGHMGKSRYRDDVDALAGDGE